MGEYSRSDCYGCGENFWADDLKVVKCLGCGSKFKRCEGCYRKFTGCSDECRRLSRRALASAWVNPAPIEDKGKGKVQS
jgi:hypothetical protein